MGCWLHATGERQVAALVSVVPSLASVRFDIIDYQKFSWHSNLANLGSGAAVIANNLGVGVEQSWQARHQTIMNHAREPIQQTASGRLSKCCQADMCFCRGPGCISARMQTRFGILRQCASQTTPPRTVARGILGVPLRTATSECIGGPSVFGFLCNARGLGSLRSPQFEPFLRGLPEDEAI